MTTDSDSSFGNLGLPKYILETVAQSNYIAPTPVQEQAIPLVMEGADLLVQAQTGTGKTAAFVLPIIVKINQMELDADADFWDPHTLVLAPTRELAVQVDTFFQKYARLSPKKIVTQSVIGGVKYKPQRDGLANGASVLVATPGRLIDMVEKGDISLSAIQTLVIDEADKLLNLGFAQELEMIMAMLPSARQTLLFSATFPSKVSELADKVLRQPKQVIVDSDTKAIENIVQRVIQVPAPERRMLLTHLIKTENWQHVLVFVASKRAAANLAAKFNGAGVRAAAFHGDLSQEERTDALGRFTSHRVKLLTATDIAARGIDFPNVSHVVNFDLPRSTTDYIHRIGRTGRAGESGTAVSFIDHSSAAHFALIEKRAQISLVPERVHGFELAEEIPLHQRLYGKGPAPQKGKRKSKKDRIREASERENTDDE